MITANCWWICNLAVLADISGGFITIDGDVDWKGNPIAAGDTFEVAAGTYACKFELRDLIGTAGNEIVFTNTGGQVIISGNGDQSVRANDNVYFKILGNGHGGTTYGFSITDEFDVKSRFAVTENVEIAYIDCTARLQ